MLLLRLVYTIYLLSYHAVLAHSLIVLIVIRTASVFHALATNNIVLLMLLVHHIVRVDSMLL